MFNKNKKKNKEIRGVSARRHYNADVAIFSNMVFMNKEALFARATCSLRLPRQILRLFLAIMILNLTIPLILSSESRAECTIKKTYHTGFCYDTWNPGAPDNCGNGCTYDYANGKLTVTATKADATIPEGMFSPSYYEDNVFPKVSNIEIAGEFKNIGQHAFLFNYATISAKDGVLYQQGNGFQPFGGNTLIGTIIFRDNLQGIGSYTLWYGATLEAKVILPPTIKSIDGWALWGLRLGENAKIYCGAENCEELFRNVNCDSIGDSYKAACEKNLATLLSSGKLLPYPDGCSRMNASGCTKCKNENFKLNDGECDRLRYTPAEAAAIASDDNTNIVTLTFKK